MDRRARAFDPARRCRGMNRAGGNYLPESVRQAQRWDAVKLRYVDAGLCDRCAAQAAWGHQDNATGWDNLHSPCAGCTPVVSGLPMQTTNPNWRRFQRPQDEARCKPGVLTPPKAVEADESAHSPANGQMAS